MEVASKFTKVFNSNDLTVSKYKEIYELALKIRDYKNTISKEVSDNLMCFLGMSKYDFITFMTASHKGELSSNFYKQAITHIYTCYQNKFDAIQAKMTFQLITYNGINYYTKGKNKGDFKSFSFNRSKNDLTTCLTYLARYGNENTIEYINSQVLVLEGDKLKYYQNILDKINKFGFERLYRLALQRREIIIRKYNKKPVEFKELTFSGRCRKKLIVGYNKNYKSNIKAFISLSWSNESKTLDIPVKYSKNYHGSMKDFSKKSSDYEYTITFNEKEKQVNVNICKDGVRYIPDNKTNFIGIDVNVKHNLFSLANNTTYDYDHKLVSDYAKLCKEIDLRKSRDENYKVGKRNQYKLDKLSEKMLKSNQQLISSMCKELKEQGFDHIVMENLDNGFGKSYTKSEDINFNRIVKFIKLSSLKNEVEHIARKYDIAISTVHAEYTSKTCSKCGCIDDHNRKNQEEFICVDCGHQDNADHNASINIENRVVLTVLRHKLLKQTDNKAFTPLKFNRERVKSILLSCRYNTNSVPHCGTE